MKALRLPARSPNLNAYAERIVRHLRPEGLNRMIFFGEGSLRRAGEEFVADYHRARNPQFLENKIVQPETAEFPVRGRICRRRRHGGPLNHYYRAATG